MSIERAFCRNKEQATWLLKHGLPEKAIYQDGRGAENLDECIASFRGRPGKLVIAHDLRVFGDSKREVAATMARLEKAHIRVVDISHPGDVTVSEMLHRANQAIAGYRFRDRRMARKRGSEGGTAKGLAEERARAGIAPDWLIRNLVAEQEISWPIKIRVLGGKISQSTLRRKYAGPA